MDKLHTEITAFRSNLSEVVLYVVYLLPKKIKTKQNRTASVVKKQVKNSMNINRSLFV